MALFYRHTDEPISEHSRLQLSRCTYCRDKEWMFPWKKEDKICLLTVMYQHHFIDNVLKTTFLFWCDHCICNGRHFLLPDLYEVSCCWGVLRETVSSYLRMIKDKNRNREAKAARFLFFIFIIPLILLTRAAPKHHSASANLLSVKLLPFRPLDHPANRNAWNAGQKIFL